MKNITFNQLQLRILALLFILFMSAVFSYRYFVELPKLEASMVKLSERELSTLTSSIGSSLDILSRTNYDYAVWTSSYDFMLTKDNEYLEENFIENTFTSLKVDGFFYLDEHFRPVYTKGFHHTKLTDLTFSFYDFKKNPGNLKILPAPTIKNEVPFKNGFINTIYGPAMYSATQIRDTSMNGENRGYLIIIYLLEQYFVENMSKNTQVNVKFLNNEVDTYIMEPDDWKYQKNLQEVKQYTDIGLYDENEGLVTVLRLQYSEGILPKLINAQSLIFIFLMSIFIYIMHFLISNFIIKPVKGFALDIKKQNSCDAFAPLDEKHSVRELVIVAKNINQLIATVQRQNEILAMQTITDPLTGIMNKRGLMKEIELHCDLLIRENIGFTLVMADIDYFKSYNDSEGHLEGDLALNEVARVLNDECKRSGDICARYGGEEFTLIFSSMSDADLNKKLNDVMSAMKNLSRNHPCSPISEHITISMGATSVKPSDVVDFKVSVNDILKVADNGLYQAKNTGRNRFVINSLSEKSL